MFLPLWHESFLSFSISILPHRRMCLTWQKRPAPLADCPYLNTNDEKSSRCSWQQVHQDVCHDAATLSNVSTAQKPFDFRSPWKRRKPQALNKQNTKKNNFSCKGAVPSISLYWINSVLIHESVLPGCTHGSPLTIQIHFPPFLYHKMSYRWIYTMYKHIKLHNSCLYKMSLNLILSCSKLKQSLIVYAICAIILCNLIILMKAINKCYK